MEILKDFKAVGTYLDEVVAMADSEKSALGFLPRNIFEEQARRGFLWLAIDKNSKCVGFLLFGKNRRQEIKIKQLFVLSAKRQSGLAKTLVNELVTYARQFCCLSIQARVAADLPANKFWDKAGFKVFKQVEGGETTGRKINIRIRHLSTCLLDMMGCGEFQNIEPDYLTLRPIMSENDYVIDMNIFFDLIKRREESEVAGKIICAALEHEYKCYVTPEFVAELERNHIPGNIDPILEFAKNLPCLPRIDDKRIEELTPRLLEIVFPGRSLGGKKSVQMYSDLRHLAYCIHHGVAGFITRDQAILASADNIAQWYNVDVISPTDIANPSYGVPPKPNIIIESSEIKIVSISQELGSSAKEFLTRLGVDPGMSRKVLSSGTKQYPRRKIIAFSGGHVFAVGSWREKYSLDPMYILVDEQHSASERAIDHIFEGVARTGKPGHMRAVVLPAFCQSPLVKRTARKRGFHNHEADGQESGDMVKLYRAGPVFPEDWQKFRGEFTRLTRLALPDKLPKTKEIASTGILISDQNNTSIHKALSLFVFETLISPGLIVHQGRVAIIVPIQGDFANCLLPGVTNQFSLWEKEASLFLERAFFRTPTDVGKFAFGMPIVFYRSGNNGGAIGYARITYTNTVSIEEAKSRFYRQGVLSEEALEKQARNGKLHTFTFDNFSAFEKIIPFSYLHSQGWVSGLKMVSHEILSSKAFTGILRAGFNRT